MLLDARLKFRWHEAIHGAVSEFQLKCHIIGGCWRKLHFRPSPLLAVGDANHVGRRCDAKTLPLHFVLNNGGIVVGHRHKNCGAQSTLVLQDCEVLLRNEICAGYRLLHFPNLLCAVRFRDFSYCGEPVAVVFRHCVRVIPVPRLIEQRHWHFTKVENSTAAHSPDLCISYGHPFAFCQILIHTFVDCLFSCI